ncbi:MAG: tetratricopeptide repeat protein [Chloroflexi bacterium]|nr:tetratricopeptide repeat protein [Chloroflexota bacterium]
MRHVTPAAIDYLRAYISIDRRLALARGESLPERTDGTALFADISGFTPLADSLAQALGPQRAAEELTRQLNRVYDALVAEVHQYRGSVIGFVGDALTCWFDEQDLTGYAAPKEPTKPVRSCLRAAACALGMQKVMGSFADIAVTASVRATLAIKIGIATGTARRFVVGDPQIQLIDTLTGERLRQMSQAEQLAEQGEVVLAPSAQLDLPGLIRPGRSIPNPSSDAQFVVVNELLAPVAPTPWDDLPADALTDAQVRPWILPALYDHLRAGHAQFSSELRAATALFVLFDGIDYERDDAAGDKLDAYTRGVQRIVHHHGGNLIQLTIGDKGSFLYAVFGAPVAHDDDPYRAVQAALESQSLPTVIQHIGIAAGQMRVGAYGGNQRLTYGAISDVANLAHRLMLAAPAGEMRCDYNVYRLASKYVAFETLPPVRVKGKAGLVRVYRPLVGHTSRGAGAQGSRGEMVGRRAEIAEIETLLDAVQAGQARVLLLEGEAGMGKSRLIAELIRLARARGLTGLIGSGHSIEQQAPYRAWREVFSSYFELDEVSDATERRQRVQTLVPQLVPDQAQRLPLLDDVLGLGLPDNELTASLDPNLRQQNLTMLLTALLRAWATERPLILILEDAHWLDGLSWQLAVHIARACALARVPFLLAVVNRPLDETSAGQAAWRDLRAMDIAHSLVLSALAPDDIRALMAKRLGVSTDALAAPFVELVQSRANGNPFFAEELVFHLRDTGVMQTFEVSETSKVSLPDTLHGLILSRIDRLPPERQFILKVAAVMGRAFACTPLCHVVNQYVNISEPDLKEHLVSLTTADFTFLESLAPDLTYRFKHIITQEAAYQTLLFAQRRELHRYVAEWYERSGQWSVVGGQVNYPPSTTHYPLLVHHYHYAEDHDKERHYARLAGEQAARQYANVEAVRFFSRALELSPDDDAAARYALLSAREAVYHLQGKRQAQTADLEALVTLASTSDDSSAQVSLRRAKLAVETGDYAAAATHAQATVATAQAPRLQAAGHIEWGRALARQAQYTEARERLTQALELAQSSELRDVRADCLQTLGTILSEEGNYARAHAYLVQALSIRREMSDQPGEGHALHALGNIAIFQADYPRAAEYYARAVAIFRKIGARTDEGVTLGNLGTVALYQSDHAQAARHYAETLLIARETGSRRNESNALGNLGIVARYQGDYAQSIAHTEQALAIDRAIGHRQGAGRKLNSLGETTRMQGDYRRAAEYYAHALAIARELGEPRSESIALGNLGLAALGGQDYERALEHYTQALAIARQLGDQDRLGYTLTGLGQARAGVGQLDAAVGVLQEAIAVRRKIGQLPLLMESLAALARVYLAQGDLHAQTVAQEILAYVDQGHSLDAANEPLQIWLTCYQVLAANHNPRAAEILRMAFDRLRQRLAQVPDSAARRSLLASAPWYMEIVAQWAHGAPMAPEQAMQDAISQSHQLAI